LCASQNPEKMSVSSMYPRNGSRAWFHTSRGMPARHASHAILPPTMRTQMESYLQHQPRDNR